MSDRFKSALWVLWAAAAVALTSGIVRWHIEYFRSPGPQFYRAAIIGLPLLAAGTLVWTRWRTAFLWRYELAAIFAIPAAAALLREPRATLVVAALFSASYCLGAALCRRCGWSTDEPAADQVFSTAAGFAVLNTVLFASGLARIWHPWFFGLLLFLPIAVFHRNALRLARTLLALAKRWPQLADLRHPLVGMLIPFAAILAACTSVLMLAPTLSWDAMKMHLPLTRFYLAVHALEPKPQLDYSFFPQATESLFTLAWSLGGQAAAQLVAPGFFALSLLAAWMVARACTASPGQAFTGVMLAASLPVLHWAESVPKNDAPLTFFLLASLAAALRWHAGFGFKWVQAGALFLSSALATKDPALFGAVPLGALFLYAAWREPRRMRAIASLAAIFSFVALLWYIRRFALTGNPVFPLAPGRSMVPGWPPDPTLAGTILRMLRLPWDLHFHGHDFSETVLIAPLGIVFVLFWPVWMLTGRMRRPEWLCLGFAIAGLVLWGWLSPLVRYALAPLAVLAILTGIRMARFWSDSTTLARATLLAACLWAWIPALCGAMIVEINAPQVRYLAGAIGQDQYLSQANITYASLAWLRDHTTPAQRILGLENCSDIYAPEFPRYQSYCAFRPWTAAEVETQLRNASYDWLLAPPGDREADLAAVRNTGRAGIEMYRDPNFVIYRLQ